MAERTEGRSGTTWALMGAAVVGVAVLLWWLGATSEPSSVAIVEADTAAQRVDETGGVAATDVELGEFSVNADAFAGQRIRLQGVQVASRVGEQAFWIQLATQVPYLIRMDPAATGGAGPAPGATVNVVGTVYMMADSVLNAWEQAGVITANQRVEASFATSFLEATNVRVTQQPAGAGQQQ